MSEILEGVLDEFKNLAAIPRPSKHEERVSNFLKEYLQAQGFQVAQDENKNIVAEIPASPDKKNAPLTILQAHMDMVCVAAENYKYDPLNDPIKVIRTENFLQAEGTSLGADDGMGIAEILYLVKANNFSHGPIRIIFTTDEEQGMSGAVNLDKKFFVDAKFLINCDSENYDELVVGSAGSMRINFRRKVNYVAPEKNFRASFKIKIDGLRGGHSGIEIHKNRANAIKVMKNILREVGRRGNFQPANFSGGRAANVIPSDAEIIIVTDLTEEKIFNCCSAVKNLIQKNYDEPNFKIEVAATERPEKVFSAQDTEDFLALITLIHSGVYAVSSATNSPTQSANLGVVKIFGGEIDITFLPRSNSTDLLDDFLEAGAQIAKLTNFEVEFGRKSPAWNFNPKSLLAKIMAKIFEEQNNFKPKVHTIHAGLECNAFLEKNPCLDVVSIGTTNEFIHSPQERLHLKTVEPQVKLIAATLEKVSALD